MNNHDVKFEDLNGKVLVDVNASSEEVTFITSDGESFQMYHSQDCCEHVRIESVVGDWKDLLGHPLLLAEEVTNAADPEDHDNECGESYTWTFYKLATIKGYVDMRWLGESNGYYSESVSFFQGQDYSPEQVLALMAKNGLKVQSMLKPTEKEVKEIYQNKKSTRFNL